MMIPASANMVRGLAVRAVGKAMKRHAGKIALGGAAVAGGATIARSFAQTQRRSTSRAGVKRVPLSQMGGTARKLNFGGVSKNVGPPGNSGSELARTSMYMGKKRPMNVKKLSKVTTERRILRWQNIAPLDRASATNDTGAMVLAAEFKAANTINATVDPFGYVVNNANGALRAPQDALGDGWLVAPVHVYCLNSSADNQGGFEPARQLFIRDNDTGTINFTVLSGAQPTDSLVAGNVVSAQTGWDLESTNYALVSGTDTNDGKMPRYIQNNWYDIKLCLRNATGQKTWFEVMIVMFEDDHLDPVETPNGDPDQVQDRHALWYGLAREAVSHPLTTNKNFQRAMKKVRVLKRVRFDMERNMTTQSDTSPNCRVVKLFYRDDTVNDYMTVNTANPPGVFTGASMVNPNVYEKIGQREAEYTYRPAAKARKWLIVRAFDPTYRTSAGGATGGGTDGANTTVNAPSYDIIIRKKETRFPDLNGGA